MEYFKTFNKDNITISSNKKRITNNTWNRGSIYGVFVIDNDFNNKTVTKWLFKIHSLGNNICIGIDSSNNNYINSSFTNNKNGSIGYYSSGNAYKDGEKIRKYGDKYAKGDKISMTYNGSDSTLTFSKESWALFGKGTIKTFKPIQITHKKKFKLCLRIFTGQRYFH